MSYEDIFIYLDLTKEILKKKDLIKVISTYIQEKNKTNVRGHYGILIFQEEGNPIFITDKKDAKIITKVIDENWKNRPKEQSFFENGLFYIFSYIAETIRKKSKYNRVIVITDTPSDLNAEYQDALFNLVDKIKHFPTFIDIIRLSQEGERFFKDDVKLNILASDTKGGIFYVKDKKQFNDIINKLIKQKQIVSTFADRPDEIKIHQDDYAFYSKLAKPLKAPESWEGIECFLCHETVCPVCADVYDVPMICEECSSAFHNCCVTNYTINRNIGIPHIFRCPSCDILLSIDEDAIIEVSGEEDVISVKDYMKHEVLQEIPQDVSELEGISFASPEELTPIPTQEIQSIPTHDEVTMNSEEESVKKMRIGGFFGTYYKVRKSGEKIIYERIDKCVKRKPQAINICPVCGTSLNSSQKTCQNCGFKIE